ncbi:zinc finger TRAF-type-containing protein 1 homolog [Zophobas morio]|uniref:zinc finger TRAF-type-containing protein 1 homolog n=1 Tax=Zophobas morio TaxID=2755281 RepID=UPI00308349B9
MSENEATTSHPESANEGGDKENEFLEPENKRRKTTPNSDKKYKLEERLGGILCCAVCLDLPKAAVYQCSNGHLMCAGCFTHLLADARSRDDTPTCPTCRVEICKTTATRNLAVENAVSELPSECQFCNKQFPRNSLERHEQEECEERVSGCKYHRIGCPWRGPFHEKTNHEQECGHPKKSGAEVMEALEILDQKVMEERKLYKAIFELLGYDKITFNDIQLKPYRSDDFVHRLLYESSRFYVSGHQWLVKAKITENQKDPTQNSERVMTYQLVLKSKVSTALSLSYIVLCGPVGDIKVQPRVYKFDFTEHENETPYETFPLIDAAECNRLLAAKTINFRLIMFWASN